MRNDMNNEYPSIIVGSVYMYLYLNNYVPKHTDALNGSSTDQATARNTNT